MTLKAQDVLVVLKLCALGSSRPAQDYRRPPMAELAFELGMSASEVHSALRRARTSGLLHSGVSGEKDPKAQPGLRSIEPDRPNTTAIREFLVHGLKYVFPPSRGEMTRGLPTSYAAPPLSTLIARGGDPVPVWPYAQGTTRGSSFEPIFRTAPFAATRDPFLYELLALTDALREGRARERRIAEEQLSERLSRLDVDKQS